MKTELKNKVFIVFFILLCIPIVAMADESFFAPEYTEEYKKWTELSSEEKEQVIEPQQIYKLPQDLENNNTEVFAENQNVGNSSLPAKFSRTDYGKVRNQGSTNSCWAQSAATVFETNYFVTTSARKNFSALHMDYITSKTYNSNGFNRKYDIGGNMSIALAYATNGMGIALESNMPTNINSQTLKNVQSTAKVSDYDLITQSNIKEYIYKYGVVATYTYISGTKYFSSYLLTNNNDLAYYCSNENIFPNHAVTIVGWDDNYTNSAFEGKKGAYIALNSYGSSFGNNGLYYIFYDDVF